MPLGPFKTFGECVGAQKKKGKNDSSARKICGQIEKNVTQKAAESNVRYEDDNGHLYIKAFLLDSSENINQWGVTPESLNDRINTFIGKPLVLTENFRHPMPPEMDRVGSEYYDNDEDPYNTVKVDEIVDHWLAYQEQYRIGTIVDITEKKGTYYSIIEVTDEAAKDAFKNNDVPLFVSPAIAQLDPFEDPTHITNWTGVHLAVVSNPAYTIKKALITGQCHGESERCLLQLRQASVVDKKVPKLGCGFCRWDALARYAEVVKSWRTKHSTVVITKDPHQFVNSSIGFSNTNSNLELTDQDNQNTTNDTNKKQEFEKKQEEQGGDLGEQPQKGQVTEKTTNKETEEETKEVTKQTAEEIAIKVAGMAECVQIFQQNGVQDPQQAQQICKLAAQALMENQDQQGKTPGGGPSNGNGPPRGTGQFGSTAAEYEKELTKKELLIADLQEKLKSLKKDDKTDAQRIAELEETVTQLNRNLKEKEIESYLVTKIADEKFRNEKIKRFADLGLSLDDIKDIFEVTPTISTKNNNQIKKVAEVVQQSPITPKVKLQVASTSNEENNNQDTKTNTNNNEVRERNNRILSSLLSNKGFN